MSDNRVDVRKTYKLLINGAFPRSESGRSYEVHDADGNFLANAAWASRKDARDAVVAARGALAGWSSMTAYNRGQVLYRVAEMLESRRDEFVSSIRSSEGVKSSKANSQVERAIDRVVWYAGWTDKVAQVFGNANPVAGPFFNFSIPTPTGVIGVLAPQESSLLGLISTLAPPLAVGNTVVVVASEQRPLPAILLAELTATSDVPAGVVNILTGRSAELAGVLAAHEDVDGLDLSGASDAAPLAAVAAAESIKRVFRPRDVDVEWNSTPDTRRLRAFIETSTVWHTVGQ
jgi:acyl-CoA reductase-like NAD-dependent aldehyde dehydrogenase